MKLARLAAILVFGSLASQARAEEVEGVVRTVGTAIEPETLITPEKEFQGVKLCGSPMEQRIRHLSSLFVKVDGNWKLKKNGERSCLTVSSFSVTKMNSGRPPAVGTLAEKNGVYSISSEDGKDVQIADVPPGLKKLVGQKVLVDLKATAVVTYLAFP